MLLHFSWGYLVLLSAYCHKKRYLLIALPMGLVDALVPFAKVLTLPGFEALVFAISLLALYVALASTKKLKKQLGRSETDLQFF